MAIKTKAQLEDQIKELKEEIRQLRSKIKADESVNLPEKGFVVCKNGVNFIKYDVEFDPETKVINISGETNLGRDIAIVLYKLKEILSLRIHKL